MKSYKQIINELPVSPDCHLLSDEELHKLQRTMLAAYKDVEAVCEKYGLSIAMCGGNAIGALRHKGYIPWDDDVDLMMSREDFEQFKKIFDTELGDRYVLNGPNYSEKPTNRFFKILIKNTRFVEMGMDDDDRACIKMDLFILENMPQNKIIYSLKGLLCNSLMYIASVVSIYESRVPAKKSRLAATKEGLRLYRRRVFIGRFFSFMNHYRWLDLVDTQCQYHRPSSLIGAPTDTWHYFGSTMDREILYPFRQIAFEDTKVYIPHNTDAYLRQLYGDYMVMPPEEKREHHYVRKIEFISDYN